jgi:two-component system cell cycle sensor histidine kinase/response regulator CckA
MRPTPIRVLLIEDDEDDYLITRDLFSEIQNQTFNLEWVADYESGLKKLALRSHDVYLVDYRLGPHNGIEFLREANIQGCTAPIILLTGLGARDVDIAAMEAGAADYLVKGQITPVLLERSISHSRQRKEAEQKLRESEEQYRLLFDQNPHPMWVVEVASSQILAANHAAVSDYGYAREEFLGMKWKDIDANEQLDLGSAKQGAAGTTPRQTQHRRKDGSVRPAELTSNRISFQDKDAWLVLAIDVSQRLDLEAQLRQSQKMESIGTLAGGVAHDFNNILGIISGYCYYVRNNRGDADRVISALEAIEKSVDRGAGLVRQILTFARKTEVQWEAIDLGAVVHEAGKLLATTFPKTISFTIQADPRIPPLLGDSTQLHQTILNLCVNARDAMPNGGRLTIRTEMLPLDEVQRHFPAATEQAYALLSVTDTGSGMDEQTRSRIFEPFFTTKSREKGTGLGLAVVYGIIKSHNGFISVQSAVGEGTCFQLWLPILPAPASEQSQGGKEPQSVVGGNETILFVEDEEFLLDLMKTLLEDQGYKIIPARDGLEAVAMFSENKEAIQLVVCDMGLPNLGGWEACQRMREIRPGIPSILASGYVEPHVKTTILQNGASEVVQKPYNPSDLFVKIRRVLDRTVNGD